MPIILKEIYIYFKLKTLQTISFKSKNYILLSIANYLPSYNKI